MQTTALVKFVVDKIEDMKGRDVAVLDVQQQSSITDHMVICSGNSKRHVQSIAHNILSQAKQADVNIIGSEGTDAGEWVLVDLGDVVVHVMQDDTRDFYQLEKLWKPQAESQVG